ncbi:MAG: hypothetical protein E5X67_36210 [Mesorhizobium sp.]|uniref:hypothetical protein n=1 Tax=Mesorhizobium sp. TaxID=1871066 RepID=UPI00120D3A5B|nr:hypothetical protein [Mesorhizobium sp.]TIP22708.1 MAG: hypothetical protein E5X67_36210 [Mesorhizobium sp.]
MSAAEASVAPARGLITRADIDRGYDACSIIRVCELAVEQIPELGQEGLVNEAVGDIGRLLRIAGQMAGESLGVLELAEMKQRNNA